MWRERISLVALSFVLIVMIYFIPAHFVSGAEFSGWGFAALLLSLSFAHAGILTNRTHLNIPTSILLATLSAYCLHERDGADSLFFVCMLLCASTAILSMKGNAKRVSSDKHALAQSSFILLITLSVFVASTIEFIEPDIVVLCQNYLYGIVVLTMLEKLFGFPSYIRMSYLSMCAAYYVYLYARLAPFSYPFWLATFIVNILFLIYALYYCFTQFSPVTEELGSGK